MVVPSMERQCKGFRNILSGLTWCGRVLRRGGRQEPLVPELGSDFGNILIVVSDLCQDFYLFACVPMFWFAKTRDAFNGAIAWGILRPGENHGGESPGFPVLPMKNEAEAS